MDMAPAPAASLPICSTRDLLEIFIDLPAALFSIYLWEFKTFYRRVIRHRRLNDPAGSDSIMKDESL
jgi:hypothetical protein